MAEKPTIGTLLRRARKRAGLSLGEVAEEARMSISTLSRIETGKQSVEVETLIHIASILGEDPGALVSTVNGEEEGTDPLLGKLRVLGREERIEIWTQLAEAARHTNVRRRSRAEELREEVDELLAQIDFLRAEMESVRRRIR